MPVTVLGPASRASNVEQLNYVCNEWGHCWHRHYNGYGYYYRPYYYGGWHRGWGFGGWHHWHPHYYGGWGYGGWHYWHHRHAWNQW